MKSSPLSLIAILYESTLARPFDSEPMSNDGMRDAERRLAAGRRPAAGLEAPGVAAADRWHGAAPFEPDGAWRGSRCHTAARRDERRDGQG